MNIQLTQNQLLELNAAGIVPGPGESEESFFHRAQYCLGLKNHLSDELKENLDVKDCSEPEILIEAEERLKGLYDISPSWIPLFFSNYQLPFWHGGCAWIFQTDENSPTGALIQLRRALASSSRYLRIYNRDELLMHELVHIGRMAFHEPQFEEILAYNTAPSFFRKYLGPIVQSSMESLIFIFILFIIVVFDVFLIALHRPDAYAYAMSLKAIPIALAAYAGIRLWRRRKAFSACLANLEKCLESQEKARAAIYRLSDREIWAFAQASPQEIKHYAMAHAPQELRWKTIVEGYF